MNAPLSKKLDDVKWGEFKIGDLFEKQNLKFKKGKFDKEKDVSRILTDEYSLPLVNAKDGDNGIMYYGRPEDFENVEMSIDIVNDGAVSTGNVYSQPQKTGVLYNAYLIKSKFELNSSQLHFFTTTIQKSIKLKFSYELKASWERLKEEFIQLPKNKDGNIDFDFMEAFIRELAAYLKVSGFDNYELSKCESEALAHFNSLKWKEFNLIDVFDVKNTHNILSNEIKKDSGSVPYLCASSVNNGVSSYISYKEKLVEKGNCIFIGGKTFVVSYQEKDFFSNDSHNLALYVKDLHPTKLNQLYLATCVYKGLNRKYTWGDSISGAKIKSDKIMLPVISDGSPDYAFMGNFISAVQKLVIKDVVLYADKKIAATKQAVHKNSSLKVEEHN